MKRKVHVALIAMVSGILVVAQLGIVSLFGTPLHRVSAAPPVDCNSVTEIPVSECNALLPIVQNNPSLNFTGTCTQPSPWTGQPCTGWNTTAPCSWFGVQCASGHVYKVKLENTQLVGPLPDFSQLNYAIELILDHNLFTGSFPSLGGNTTLYTLNIGVNQLTGPVPDLGGLTQLHMFIIWGNHLSGIIPDDITTDTMMGYGLGGMYLCAATGYSNNLTAHPATDAWISARQAIGWIPGVGCGVGSGTTPTPGGVTVTPTSIFDLPESAAAFCCLVTATPPASGSGSVSTTSSVGGTFYLRLHNSTGFADISVNFSPGSQPYPLVGDWTGAGYETVGSYDRANGLFSLCKQNDTTACANSANVLNFVLGNLQDMPISGRWQSGATTMGVGVFRPSNGLIFLKNALVTGYADNTMILGIPGDTGLAGDWTGKGFDSPGVYRPGNQHFYLSNVVTSGPVYGDIDVQFGNPGDLPIVGDWIGQGHAGIGVFRQSDGSWYLKNTLVTGFADNSFVYGVAGDTPLAGRWQLVYPPIANEVLVQATSAPSYLSTPTPAALHD